MKSETHATIDDLYTLPDDVKAEIVNGELALMSPTGDLPNRAAGAIYVSLRQYERVGAGYDVPRPAGRAYTDNAGFIVDLPHRRTFSPDAAFYSGPRTGGKFLQGAPVFAAEVRSEGDYDAQAEQAIAAKRADYFATGTLVVWDVDVLKEQIVRVYRATDPENPTTYGRGEVADAEEAIPGWRMPVDDLFE